MTQTDPSEIADRLDRSPVTGLHIAVTALCAVGFMFDLMEIALGSVLSAVFTSPPYKVSSGELSLLLSSVYIGAILGAPALGWWADRHGRRNTLMGVLLWLSAMSLAAVFVEDVQALTAVRVMAGLALGAYPPLMIAFLTDILPPRQRGMLIFVTVGIASLGPVAGIFLVRGLSGLQPLGLDAWRWGFLVGSVGAGLSGILFRAIPESPRWLLARGRHAEADEACRRFEATQVVAGLVPSPPAFGVAGTTTKATSEDPGSLNRRRALVGGLFLLSPWSTVAFPLLTGALLTQRGFKLSDALLYVGLSNFGPLVGALLSAFVIDKFDRKVTLACCTVGMLSFGAAFIAAETHVALIVSSIGFNLSSFLYITALNLYGAELFPAPTRAATIASSWALNRLGAAVAPLLLLPLLRGGGPSAMFAVIAATLAATLVLLWIGPPGQQRKSVS